MAKWVCTICGYECEGDTPEVPCPGCGAGEEASEKVEEYPAEKPGPGACGRPALFFAGTPGQAPSVRHTLQKCKKFF